MNATTWNGKEWTKCTIVAWLPGNLVGSPACVYYLQSDKDRTLLWSPLYGSINGARSSLFRAV